MKMIRLHQLVLIGVVSALLLDRPLMAQVTQYTDFAPWQAAAGPFTTIGFTEFPAGTFITTQYAALGVTMIDGDDFVIGCGCPESIFLDGFGLDGFLDLNLTFSAPMTSIAVHYPGVVQFQLFNNGQLIFTSGMFGTGPGQVSAFAGLVSSQPFDSAIILDWASGTVTIDNLYFGPPIPAPSAAGAIAVACLIRPRRRRC
jgi:hypothetical protein